jgi:hypothetical protein
MGCQGLKNTGNTPVAPLQTGRRRGWRAHRDINSHDQGRSHQQTQLGLSPWPPKLPLGHLRRFNLSQTLSSLGSSGMVNILTENANSLRWSGSVTTGILELPVVVEQREVERCGLAFGSRVTSYSDKCPKMSIDENVCR